MNVPRGKPKLTDISPVTPAGTVIMGIAPAKPVNSTDSPPTAMFMPGVMGRASNTFPPVDDAIDAPSEVSVTTTPTSW